MVVVGLVISTGPLGPGGALTRVRVLSAVRIHLGQKILGRFGAARHGEQSLQGIELFRIIRAPSTIRCTSTKIGLRRAAGPRNVAVRLAGGGSVTAEAVTLRRDSIGVGHRPIGGGHRDIASLRTAVGHCAGHTPGGSDRVPARLACGLTAAFWGVVGLVVALVAS